MCIAWGRTESGGHVSGAHIGGVSSNVRGVVLVQPKNIDWSADVLKISGKNKRLSVP